jgi:hypothetical protein
MTLCSVCFQVIKTRPRYWEIECPNPRPLCASCYERKRLQVMIEDRAIRFGGLREIKSVLGDCSLCGGKLSREGGIWNPTAFGLKNMPGYICGACKDLTPKIEVKACRPAPTAGPLFYLR